MSRATPRAQKTHARYARIHTPTNRHTLLEAGPTLGRTNGEPLHRLHPTYTGHPTQKTLPTRVSESITPLADEGGVYPWTFM